MRQNTSISQSSFIATYYLASFTANTCVFITQLTPRKRHSTRSSATCQSTQEARTTLGLVAFSVTNQSLVSITCRLAFSRRLQISSYFCSSTAVLYSRIKACLLCIYVTDATKWPSTTHSITQICTISLTKLIS